MIWSQSKLKSFENESCPRKWFAESTGEVIIYPSDDMKKGSYFEYLCLGGGSGKSEDVKDLPRTKDGKKYIDQVRIEHQAKKFNKLFTPGYDFLGYTMLDKQVKIENKTPDGVVIDGTLDFICDDDWLFDLKLTRDLDGYWSAPEKIDHIQLVTYSYLYEQVFRVKPKTAYIVFEYAPKLRVKMVKVNISDYDMLKRFNNAETITDEYSLLSEYPRVPNNDSCSKCLLECGVRSVNKVIYEEINV